MGVVGFIILVWVIYSNVSGNRSGDIGDKRGFRYGAWSYGAVSLYVIGYFIVRSNSVELSYYYIAVGLVVASCGYLADILSWFGCYRVAYYLGRLNIFSFTRNSAALDLYRSFRAASRQATTDAKYEALQWLHTRCYKNRGQIFSGEMIMFVIIDAQLTHPNNDKYIATRLRMLNQIPGESIPSAISTYASKLALLPALSQGDWPTIALIAEQWNTPAKNFIAKFLHEYDGCYFREQYLYSKFNCWIFSLFLRRERRELVSFAKFCFKSYQFSKKRDDMSSPKHRLLNTQQQKLGAKVRKQIYEQLINTSSEKHWQQRATELGINDNKEAWKTLIQSLNRCKKLRESSEYIQDEKLYNEIEQFHRSIYYLNVSIANKLDKKMKEPSLLYFIDWLQILHILDELKGHKREQLQAFHHINSVIWNWVADLWNIRKDRCLAHYIAVVCCPLAYECGENELGDILSGITSGGYR